MFIRITDINKTVKDLVGRKAYNCGILRQSGINCPDGIVLTYEIDKEDMIELKEYLKVDGLYGIRSSMSDEDSEHFSCAGKYETRLCVKGKDVIDNIHEMLQEMDIELESKALLVQEMIPAEASGVLFTRNPLTGEDSVVINASYGAGENVVSGLSNPDCYEIIEGKIKKMIEDKSIVFSYGYDSFPGEHLIFNGCDVRTVISNDYKTIHSIFYSDKRKAVLSDENIEGLVNLSKRIRDIFGEDLDIEFCIYKNRIYILQVRPITAITKISEKKCILNMKKGNMVIKGKAASSGCFKGKVLFINYYDNKLIEKIEKNDEKRVLVTLELTPELLYKIDNIGAIVTSKSGILSHGAIVARERRIPCVVGLLDKIFELKDGTEVFVNGDTGEVII